MANRLAGATSPYLEQHKDNPVDWWPWCAEAFLQAQSRDVPVLISVGYAACHWCHVMAHESFEDPGVAAVVNEAVVPIKVDREERPDIDAVYMAATQAMTGHGGWPMTVFATPDGEPFFCGTYYPPVAFVRLVRAVAQSWAQQRDALVRQGAVVVEALGRAQGGGFSVVTGSVNGQLLDAAAAALRRDHDVVHGGFGGAPKFPPHMALLFLLRQHQRTGDPQALEVVRHTCEAMARGGIYDQLDGGFARYSVDEKWIVPHFEKMLYDNALLLRVYTQLWRLSGDTLAGRVARETAGFLLAGLATACGGFASSLDADTDGHEGRTYVWTPDQLVAVLGTDDAAWAADLFGVTEGGTFEHSSVLRLARDVDAADRAVRQRWRVVTSALRAARQHRPQPGRDEKVVAAWNGLAITALVELALVAGAVAGPAEADDPDPRWTEIIRLATDGALAAATVLAERHLVGGRLLRVSRAGRAGEPAGVLEDYGCVAEALCAVHQLTGTGRWLELAGGLLDAALAHFTDTAGGFFDTADDAERLVTRPADPTDNATPSGLSSMVAALTAYSALSGDGRYREAAVRALETIAPVLANHPRFAGYACAAAEALISGPYEIAVATHDAAGEPLARAAWRHAPPGTVVVAGPPDLPGVPLLAARSMIDGRPTAYVCRGFVCDRPVTTIDDLVSLLEPAGRP